MYDKGLIQGNQNRHLKINPVKRFVFKYTPASVLGNYKFRFEFWRFK
jgi:hypothetical protein